MTIERRERTERRQRDAGPPQGGGERRRYAERRLPVADETELSVEEFTKLFGKAGGKNDLSLDQSLPVFDRVRDDY